MSDAANPGMPEARIDAVERADVAPGLSVDSVRGAFNRFLRSEAFIPSAVLFAGIFLVFWILISGLPGLWLDEDGYYSHGFLIPFLSGYMIYLRWPQMKDTPVKSSLLAGLLIIPCLWLAYAGQVSHWLLGASIFFLMILVLATAYIAGWRWAKNLLFGTIGGKTVALGLVGGAIAGLFATAAFLGPSVSTLALGAFIGCGLGLAFVGAVGPIPYLGFCLPMWSLVIDNLTPTLQEYSTQMALQILKLCQFQPMRGTGSDSATIYLSRFALNVAVPCSGLKLLIAVTAFCLLFIGISDIKWWARILLLALTPPLCIFINGLRVAMIGMVGDTWGDAAGHQFHDYSGYIALVICFFILMKLTRALGWK